MKTNWKKLETFNSIYFWVKSHFEEDGKQNYLVFQTMNINFKRIVSVGSDSYICYSGYKGLCDEKIISINASSYKVTSQLSYYCTEIKMEFNGSCLK